MNAMLRYAIMATINCLLLIGFLGTAQVKGWDLSQRLIDVDFSNSASVIPFFVMLVVFIFAFFINILMMFCDNEVSDAGFSSPSNDLSRIIRSITLDHSRWLLTLLAETR